LIIVVGQVVSGAVTEHIPGASHGVDEAWTGRVGLDTFAHPRHMYVNRPRIVIWTVVLPDRTQNLSPRQHDAVIPCEIRQQIELAPFEADPTVASGHGRSGLIREPAPGEGEGA